MCEIRNEKNRRKRKGVDEKRSFVFGRIKWKFNFIIYGIEVDFYLYNYYYKLLVVIIFCFFMGFMVKG